MSSEADAEADAVTICRELIRIDSSNYGDDSGPGERAAAEKVIELLSEVGYDPTYLESRPTRGSVLLRIPGADRARDRAGGARAHRRRPRPAPATGRWTRSAATRWTA